jgi:hypothetical protein
VPLKSTGHRNTNIGPEEVKEDPMTTAIAQKKVVELEAFLWGLHGQKCDKRKSQKSPQIKTSFLPVSQSEMKS